MTSGKKTEPSDLSSVFLSFIIACFPMFITLLLFGGIIFLVIRRSRQSKALREASQNWPTTNGKVLKSRASDKIWRAYSSRDAYDTVDKYPVGSIVTVYYNPADPQHSALEH
jgi:hypothetical protein